MEVSFNSRAPRGARRQQLRRRVVGLAVSIHALLAERDAFELAPVEVALVSIHALLAERDLISTTGATE